MSAAYITRTSYVCCGATHIILASLPSFCQNYQNWWKFDEVLTKQFYTGFSETRCMCHAYSQKA